MSKFFITANVFSLAFRWGNRSTELSNYHKRLIEKLKTLRIYADISRFRAEKRRNEIEMKYKYMFELLDLDWYGYLELQRINGLRKKSKLKEICLNTDLIKHN